MSEKTKNPMPIGGACPECGCDGTHHVGQSAPAIPTTPEEWRAALAPTVPLEEHQRVQAEAAAKDAALAAFLASRKLVCICDDERLDQAPCPQHAAESEAAALAGRALRPTAATGWLSPEEAEKLRARNLELVGERNAAMEKLAIERAERTGDEGGETRGYEDAELNEYALRIRVAAERGRAKKAEAEAEKLRAEAGAMRLVLRRIENDANAHVLTPPVAFAIDHALSADAGRDLLARLERAEKERDELRECRDRMREEFLLWRNIEGEPCRLCGGAGVRSYPNTATWRGGYGGQAITSAVCDGCWGSGDPKCPGADLRKAAAEVRRAVEEEREQLAHSVLPTLDHCAKVHEFLGAKVVAKGIRERLGLKDFGMATSGYIQTGPIEWIRCRLCGGDLRTKIQPDGTPVRECTQLGCDWTWRPGDEEPGPRVVAVDPAAGPDETAAALVEVKDGKVLGLKDCATCGYPVIARLVDGEIKTDCGHSPPNRLAEALGAPGGEKGGTT